LIESYQLEQSVKDKLRLIENNSKRMLNLITQLLDFRKSEYGLLNLKLTHRDFILFSKEVFQSFENIAERNKVNFYFKSEVEELFTDFDKDQMEIVICNLLSNAFKYIRDHGKITLSIKVEADNLILTVSDNGVGISEENKEKVFNRFFQVQNPDTSKMAGSGIGLAFSKNIIDLHSGDIQVESKLKEGTSFIVTLPLRSTSNGTIKGSDSPFRLSGEVVHEDLEFDQVDQDTTTGEMKEIKILVADDNDDIREYLRDLLHSEYEIIEAADGIEAFTIINRELPDLIISDVMMPNMDGIKLCHEVKKQISTSHIPIILLTARTSLEYELEGLQMGAEDYITKPFNPGIVRTKIATILENRKKLQEHFFNKIRFEPSKMEVQESNLDSEFIEKAIRIVNENLQNENFGIESLVDQLYMSQSTLFRKIKSLTGMSITGFIRSIKLKTAAQLILKFDMKLSQVAHESGFNDYKHFKKSFEQQFGCLPSEYKNKILEEIK
jgi:DNA-binding response OmpR family regulator